MAKLLYVILSLQLDLITNIQHRKESDSKNLTLKDNQTTLVFNGGSYDHWLQCLKEVIKTLPCYEFNFVIFRLNHPIKNDNDNNIATIIAIMMINHNHNDNNDDNIIAIMIIIMIIMMMIIIIMIIIMMIIMMIITIII